MGYHSPGLPSPELPSPGDLPGPGIDPASPALTGKFFTTEPPKKLTQEVCGGGVLKSGKGGKKCEVFSFPEMDNYYN